MRPSRPSFLLGLFLAAAPALALGGAFGATGGTLLSGTISFQDSAGNTEGQIVTSSGSAVVSLVQGTGTSSGAVMLIGNRALVGTTGSVASNGIAVSFGEGFNTSAGTGTTHISVYGSGALQFNTQQTVTIADDGAGTSPTDTTSPTASFVRVSCADANGCNYNPGETSVVDGWVYFISNVSSSANNVTINDSAGVVSVRGGASVVLGQNEMITCIYTNSINICED